MSPLEREAGILQEIVTRYSGNHKENAHCIVHYTPPLRLSRNMRKIAAINEGIEDHKENIIYN